MSSRGDAPQLDLLYTDVRYIANVVHRKAWICPMRIFPEDSGFLKLVATLPCSLSLSLSLSRARALCLSLSLARTLCPSISLSVCLSVSLSLSLSLYLAISLCLSVSLSLLTEQNASAVPARDGTLLAPMLTRLQTQLLLSFFVLFFLLFPSRPTSSGEEMFVDVGIYGVPGSGSGKPGKTDYIAAPSSRRVEDFVRSVEGYQMLYADMYVVLSILHTHESPQSV